MSPANVDAGTTNEPVRRPDFIDELLRFFAGDAATTADAAIRRYFDQGYTGSQFERLADADPDRVTADDIVAVSMLGVQIPAAVSLWLLSEHGNDTVRRHLIHVPTDMDIWEGGR